MDKKVLIWYKIIYFYFSNKNGFLAKKNLTQFKSDLIRKLIYERKYKKPRTFLLIEQLKIQGVCVTTVTYRTRCNIFCN